MSGKSGLTAWERWELASFDSAESGASNAGRASRAEAAVPPEPTCEVPDGPTSAELDLAALRQSTYDEAFAAGRHDGYADGHKEGFVAGQAAGEAAGREAAQQQGREQAKRLTHLVNVLDEQLSGLDGSVANDLLDLALEVARKVVGHTLAVRPEAVVDVIHEALTQLPVQHAAIHLNPDDASLARLYAGDALAHAGHRIHEDAKLERGDVVIECGGSQVDATVATRWRRVVETLGRAHEGKLDHTSALPEVPPQETPTDAPSPAPADAPIAPEPDLP